MDSDSEIAKRFKKESTQARRGLSRQYENSELCQGYYNDSDSTYSDQVQFADESGRKRRALVNFQKIPQNIDGVVGFMAQNRREAKFTAHVQGDKEQELYSRNMNALHSFHRDRMNADQLESRQDLDTLVCGYGAIDTDLSYIVGRTTQDPNGEILKRRLDPMRVYWDSAARSPNVTDSRFSGYYDDYDLSDALDLFQNSKEEDFEEAGADSAPDDSTGYIYNPWGGLYDKIKANDSVEWTAKEEEMVRVYNHQYYKIETFYRAKNPLFEMTDVMTAMHAKMRLDAIKGELKTYSPDGITAGDSFDFDPTAEELTFDEKTKSKLVKEFGFSIDPVPFKRRCYYTVVISGKHVFAHFKSISQSGFSIKFKTGNYNERGKFWIGMVNAMIEPQKYYNKALTELMFTIAANSKGGVYVEEDAVEDIADFESKYAKTDAVIKVASGALAAGKIQDKTRPAVPTNLESIITLSDATIAANGVDPAFLGQANDNETGVLYKRRIRQIISKMWWIADAITLYQKEDARLCEDLIRIWVQNNSGQWINITGPDGADKFVQITENMMAPAYDVSIQEGAQTPEDRAETAAFIKSLGDTAAAAGAAQQAGQIYVEAIKLMPIDSDVVNRLAAILAPDQQTVPAAQYQQLQQQLQALQSQMTQAQVANVQSMTALNSAKIAESQATAKQKMADSANKLQDAQQKGIESAIIQMHAKTANVTV